MKSCEQINTNDESSVIVGGSLAGLVTAIKIKQTQPGHDVMIVEKPQRQSNSLISGQRYRDGAAGSGVDAPDELVTLLASRNSGDVTEQMELFAREAHQQISQWQATPGFMEHHKRNEWFGPQWGTASGTGQGRGHSVVKWFEEHAKRLGVHFFSAEAQRIIIGDDGSMSALEMKSATDEVRISADNYILAAGNAGGYLFESTNRAISKSGTELLFEAGIGITDTTVHMIHPFGRANKRGEPTIGCFETDNLSSANVFLDGTSDHPIFDAETTELLRTHEAHDHFPDLVKRFYNYGGVVLLVFPDSSSKLARVSHHYSQFGVSTHDGVRSTDVKNLFVVGDTAGSGYWTNHKERLPGFALTKILVDATLVAGSIAEGVVEHKSGVCFEKTQGIKKVIPDRCVEKRVRKINTNFLLELVTSSCKIEQADAASRWVDELYGVGYDSPQVRLSKFVASSY